MHEWGITESLIKEILRHAEESGINNVEKVCISIGEKSRLTNDSIKFCFQSLTRETILANTELEFIHNSGPDIIIESIEGENNLNS